MVGGLLVVARYSIRGSSFETENRINNFFFCLYGSLDRHGDPGRRERGRGNGAGLACACSLRRVPWLELASIVCGLRCKGLAEYTRIAVGSVSMPLR